MRSDTRENTIILRDASQSISYVVMFWLGCVVFVTLRIPHVLVIPFVRKHQGKHSEVFHFSRAGVAGQVQCDVDAIRMSSSDVNKASNWLQNLSSAEFIIFVACLAVAAIVVAICCFCCCCKKTVARQMPGPRADGVELQPQLGQYKNHERKEREAREARQRAEEEEQARRRLASVPDVAPPPGAAPSNGMAGASPRAERIRRFTDVPQAAPPDYIPLGQMPPSYAESFLHEEEKLG